MKRLEKKHPLAIRWFHWINFPVLMAMIWSGLLIYWSVSRPGAETSGDVYRIGWGNWTLFRFFPSWFYHPGYNEITDKGKALYNLDHKLATGMAWHFTFMWFFAVNGLLYVIYLATSGEWRFLLPNRATLKEAFHVVLHDLHLRREPLPRRKFNGAQRIAYTSVIVMGGLSLLTGLAIHKSIQLGWLTNLLGGYTLARFWHFWLTMGFCGFFLIHVLQVLRAGWNNFRAMITGYEIVRDEDTRVENETPVRSAP